MTRPTMLYETRRAAEALAKAIRHFRLPAAARERYIVQPRACGQGFEVIWYAGGPAIPYHGVGLVVEPLPVEHDLAMWFMQQERN